MIILTPSNQYSDVNASQKLLLELQQLPLVDKAQLDLEWVKRLQAIMTLVQQGIDALALLFGVAVLLIVGNTIRLANALIKANKRFDFFIMPGQRHGYGDETEYFFWLRADYFCQHLIGDYSISTDIFEMRREFKMTPSKTEIK